jgi:tetratricopeptide (TPR) repeat protein
VDEIVSALTANTSLDVISTLSTRVYRDSQKPAQQIAQELVADGLIESTFIEDGNNLTLHIRLTDGTTGEYIWDHQLEISRESLFEVQNRLEGVLYSEFRPVWLHVREHLKRAGTVEAYALFLEGKQLFNLYQGKENHKAIEKFRQALDKDPDFAPAWAALARAYGNIVNMEESVRMSWLEKADDAAEKAIELAPNLPDGYCARGANAYSRYLYFGTDERSNAEKDFEIALRLSPDFPDALLAKAFLLMCQGVELEETSLVNASLEYYERALTLQPNVPNGEANYALALARAGQFDVARRRLEQALSNNPASARLYITLGNIALLKGDIYRAAEVTEEAIRRNILSSPLHDLRLAAFHAAAGDRGKAREILSRVRGPMSSFEEFHMASVLAGVGSNDEALEKLRTWKQKVSRRDEQLGFFRWWLRSDPNFKELRERGDLEPFLRGKNGPSA